MVGDTPAQSEHEYPSPDDLFRDARAGETVPCDLVGECPVHATHVVEADPEHGVCDGHYLVLEARAGFHQLNGGPLPTGRSDR